MMSTNKNTEPTLSSAHHYQDDHFEQEVIIRSKTAFLFEFWQLWAQKVWNAMRSAQYIFI